MALAMIYTSSSCTVGTPKLPGSGSQRFSDAVNMHDSEFFELTDASVRSLLDNNGVAEGAQGNAIVRRRDVLLVVPLGEQLIPGSAGRALPREVVRVALSVTPYRITGMAHLPPNVGLGDYLHNYGQTFAGITDAKVTLQVNPVENFEAPFLLVNRDLIDTAGLLPVSEDLTQPLAPEASPAPPVSEDLTQPPAPEASPAPIEVHAPWVAEEWLGNTAKDTTAPVQRPEPGPDEGATRPQSITIRGEPISGAEAARVLAGCPMFNGVNPERLERTCQQVLNTNILFPNLRIRRRELGPGDELFSAGERAEGLYIVATGMLRAVVARSGPTLGYLGPGDVIGEMAVLGDGYHTAGVVAESEAAVIVIPAEALNELMSKIPSAPRLLLGIMYRRIQSNSANQLVRG